MKVTLPFLPIIKSGVFIQWRKHAQYECFTLSFHFILFFSLAVLLSLYDPRLFSMDLYGDVGA